MVRKIERDVYILSDRLKARIEYTRATNMVDLVFHFRDYQIPEGAVANVYMQKPSGKAVYNNATIEGNDIIVNATKQMFAELGNSALQIRLKKDGEELVTFEQPVFVKQNYTAGDFQSENESGFFEEYEEKLKEATEKANNAAENADEKAGKAETAAGNANEATNEANTAAEAANTGAERANTAAEAAEAAAGNANEAANEANTAAEAANKVAQDVKEKAENGEFTGTIEIGNVVTGEPGTEASVTNRGTKQNAVLDMVIPEGKTGQVENIDTVTIEFEQAEARENINSGENFSGIFGKVKKWFADLGTAAFMKIANNLLTTEEGFLLDARQGKVLDEKISELTSKLEFNLEDHWGGADFSGTVKATVIGHNVMLSIILQTAREIEAGVKIKARAIPNKHINIAPSEVLLLKSISERNSTILFEMGRDGILTIYPYVTLPKSNYIYGVLNYII